MTDPTIHITDPTLDPTGRFTMSNQPVGLNLLTDSIANLTTTNESNTFQVRLETTDPTAASLIHARIQQLIYNLGDRVYVEVAWDRTQSERLINSLF